MSKPFTSIDDQIALLNARGVSTDGDTYTTLLREGYYSIVNGYKEPFIDQGKTSEDGDDRYVEGTAFSDIYALFSFDRDLKEHTFHYLIRAEAMIKAVVAYVFAEAHPNANDYLLQSSFASEDEHRRFGLSRYHENMSKLNGVLFKALQNTDNQPVSHYLNKYGDVPVWVLFNCLTFGNVQHFFNLMKPAEQREVCKNIVKATGRAGGYFDPRRARISMDVIVRARNICAHDDRLYCAMIGPRRNKMSYAQMLAKLGDFMSPEEFDKMLDGVAEVVSRYSDENKKVAHILKKTGIIAHRVCARAASPKRS